MKQTTLIFIFAVWCAMGWGQATTTPTVIASTGKYYGSPGQLEVSYTIGEMTAVSTAGNTNGLHVTQGFHQPEEWGRRTVGLPEQTLTPIDFLIYPNPASNSIETIFDTPEIGKAKISITDYGGKLLQTIEENHNGGKDATHFDIKNLASGSYIVTLQFTGSEGKQYFSSKPFSVTH